jgi:hypothetical protein
MLVDAFITMIIFDKNFMSGTVKIPNFQTIQIENKSYRVCELSDVHNATSFFESDPWVAK